MSEQSGEKAQVCGHCGQTLPHVGTSWRESDAYQRTRARGPPRRLAVVGPKVVRPPLPRGGRCLIWRRRLGHLRDRTDGVGMTRPPGQQTDADA